MKENSIEKTLENIQNVDLITLLRKFKKEGVENFIVIRRNDFDEILSDYKRVLKENEKLIEELKQDDINMTRKYKEKKNITGELLDIDKVRVRAYREKTREIKEKLHKLLIETIETKGE